MLLEKREGIAIVTFPSFTHFPPAIIELRDRFFDICKDIEMDDDVRVVIITSAEEVKENGSLGLKELFLLVQDFPAERIRFSDCLMEIDRPTIAAIPKGATGLGLEILLACDIRIGAQGSNFSLPHVKEGIVPWDGGTQRVPRIVGMANAIEMLFTRRTISAEEAFELGLLNRIVPRDELMDEATSFARDMSSKAFHALRFIREAFYKGMEMPLEQALRMEGDLYLLLFTTEDRTEGIKAFREKRKADFKGK